MSGLSATGSPLRLLCMNTRTTRARIFLCRCSSWLATPALAVLRGQRNHDWATLVEAVSPVLSEAFSPDDCQGDDLDHARDYLETLSRYELFALYLHLDLGCPQDDTDRKCAADAVYGTYMSLCDQQDPDRRDR
jgi:hypothetical protein